MPMNHNIFISSTFKDMHAERDMLHLRILPEVQAFAWEYGSKIGLRDLRWGIDTSDMNEEDACNKILSICNEEIDNCEPYMVVLLGMRYGWRPNDNARSVTEMEIDRGVFSKPDNRNRILFVMRDLKISDEMSEFARDYLPEDDAAKEHILRLRQYIEEKYSDRLVRYSAELVDGTIIFDEAALAEAITDGIKGMIQEDLHVSSKLTPEEIVMNHFTSVLETYNVDRIIDTEYSQYILDKETEGKKVILLYGEDGNGKTSALIKASRTLKDRGYEVFYYTPEVAGEFVSIKKMLDLCELYIKEKGIDGKFAFLIDDIDKLDYSDMEDYLLLSWLPDVIPDNVLYVLAANIDEEDDEAIQKYKAPQYLRTVFDKKKLIADSESMPFTLAEPMLKDEGKEVSWDVIYEIIAHEPVTPLELAVLVNRLVRMDAQDYAAIDKAGGGMAKITEHMIDVINEVPYYFGEAVMYTIRRNSRSIGNDALVDAAIYIALSRRGLRMNDIIALCDNKINELEICCFTRAINIFFTIDINDTYKYKYEIARQAVVEQLVYNKTISIYYKKLCDYVATLPGDDPIRIAQLPFLAMSAGNIEILNDIVNDALQSENAEYRDKVLKIAGDDFYHFWESDVRNDYAIRFFKNNLQRCPVFMKFFTEYVCQIGSSDRFSDSICDEFIELLDAARTCGMEILEENNYSEASMREFICICKIVVQSATCVGNFGIAYQYLDYIIQRLYEFTDSFPENEYYIMEFANAYELGGKLFDSMKNDNKALDYYLKAFWKGLELVQRYNNVGSMYSTMRLSRLVQAKLTEQCEYSFAESISNEGYIISNLLLTKESNHKAICEAIRMKMHYANALINVGSGNEGAAMLRDAISEAEQSEREHSCDIINSIIAEGYTMYAMYEYKVLGRKDDPGSYFEKSFDILKLYAQCVREEYRLQFVDAAHNYASVLTGWDKQKAEKIAIEMIDKEKWARIFEH